MKIKLYERENFLPNLSPKKPKIRDPRGLPTKPRANVASESIYDARGSRNLKKICGKPLQPRTHI
jgi:hypothetical protein